MKTSEIMFFIILSLPCDSVLFAFFLLTKRADLRKGEGISPNAATSLKLRFPFYCRITLCVFSFGVDTGFSFSSKSELLIYEADELPSSLSTYFDKTSAFNSHITSS